MKFNKVEVERDEMGYYSHPQLCECKSIAECQEYLTFGDVKAWEEEMEFVFSYTEMEKEVDEDHPAYTSFFVEGDTDISAWEPIPPTEDSILLSIHANEEGPSAWWASES
ncbi:hypothetical protein S0112_051 [Shewanella phage S0112]|nr:hypothetical protein S0112_051 [Shewanella phage S0112]